MRASIRKVRRIAAQALAEQARRIAARRAKAETDPTPQSEREAESYAHDRGDQLYEMAEERRYMSAAE